MVAVRQISCRPIDPGGEEGNAKNSNDPDFNRQPPPPDMATAALNSNRTQDSCGLNNLRPTLVCGPVFLDPRN